MPHLPQGNVNVHYCAVDVAVCLHMALLFLLQCCALPCCIVVICTSCVHPDLARLPPAVLVCVPSYFAVRTCPTAYDEPLSPIRNPSPQPKSPTRGILQVCCCAVQSCTKNHRHCKAYRYRLRRAELAAKRGGAHGSFSTPSSAAQTPRDLSSPSSGLSPNTASGIPHVVTSLRASLEASNRLLAAAARAAASSAEQECKETPAESGGGRAYRD